MEKKYRKARIGIGKEKVVQKGAKKMLSDLYGNKIIEDDNIDNLEKNLRTTVQKFFYACTKTEKISIKDMKNEDNEIWVHALKILSSKYQPERTFEIINIFLNKGFRKGYMNADETDALCEFLLYLLKSLESDDNNINDNFQDNLEKVEMQLQTICAFNHIEEDYRNFKIRLRDLEIYKKNEWVVGFYQNTWQNYRYEVDKALQKENL